MPEPPYPALARRFGDALRVGDVTRAEDVIDDALAALAPPAAVQALVIAPSMERIGALWEAGVVSVAEEHLATSICQRALVRLFAVLSAARAGRPRRETVLLAGIEGQRHVLGLQMVADVLDGAGFDVLFLGGDVPVEDLRAFVEERRPSVVGLSFGIAPDTGRLVDAVLAVHAASSDTRLMLGGPGVPLGLREAGYPWVPTSLEVVRTVEELVAGPGQPVPDVLVALASTGGGGSDAAPPTEGEVDAIAEQFARVADEVTDSHRWHLRRLADHRTTTSADASSPDPLTGLLQRDAFLERLRDHADTADGHEVDPAGMVLVVDVDDLRGINALHGRSVGDDVLRRIADALREVVGADDVVGRTGGNEFMAVLPSATRGTARQVGERLRAAVAAGTRPTATVSVGTAELMADPRAVLLSASTALYTAKAARRDRQDDALPARTPPGPELPSGPRR